MGDIVASREHEAIDDLHENFNRAIEVHNRDFAGAILSPLTVTLGDEFQGMAATLHDAFAIVHAMRLYLLERDIQCRFVVGAGELETPLNPERAWNMMGKGLSEARDCLNDKKRTNCYRFTLPGQPVPEELLNTIGMTMTEIESDWTDTQKKFAIAYFSRGEETIRELARALKTSERNFYKVTSAASLKLYRRQIDGTRRALAMLDEKHAG